MRTNYTVFISCAVEDNDIRNEIEKELGKDIECKYLKEGDAAGESIKIYIKKLMDLSNLSVFIITPSGESSKWVNQEIGYAEHKKDLGEIKSIALVLTGLSSEGFLEDTHQIRFNVTEWKKGVEKIVNAIKMKKAENEKTSEPSKEDEEIKPKLGAGD